MPLLLLKLLGIGKWLTALFRAVGRYPREAAIIALLCLSGGLWWQLSGVKQDLTTERDGRAADRASYVKAQADAEVAQLAADQTNIAGQREANRRLETLHAELETARRDGVSRFIADRRVRFETACRSPSGASDPGLRDNPRPPADGQAPGDLVAVRPEQIDAWSEIELQNAERGGFLRGLVEQGLAVPQSVLPEAAFGGK